MLSLPAHPDVPAALQTLRDAGLRLVALTNSSQRAVDQQLMVASELKVGPGRIRLVAAHGWGVLGAMRAAIHSEP
jgi:2-haloacid dehalogenase